MSTLQPTVNSAADIPAPAAPAIPAISAKTWIAVIGATLGAFMAVLNIQIVNASLADIQGAIGAAVPLACGMSAEEASLKVGCSAVIRGSSCSGKWRVH